MWVGLSNQRKRGYGQVGFRASFQPLPVTMLLLVVTDVSRGYLSRKLVCVSAEMRVHCVLFLCGAPMGLLWSIICYTESEKSLLHRV